MGGRGRLLAAACVAHAALVATCACGARLGAQAGQEAAQGGRRALLDWDAGPDDWTQPGGRYVPAAGRGSWEQGGDTGAILIHANVMKGGEIVGWSNKDQGPGDQTFGSVAWDPQTREFEQLLGDCGLHDCHNAFCSGQATTADGDLLIFGGHAKDLQWFRRYTHSSESVDSQLMSSGRWYAGVGTLPDGKVLVLGGVGDSGEAGYSADEGTDNPTYELYDPSSNEFLGDQGGDLGQQLADTWPIHTYPLIVVTPDGGIAVSAGSTLRKYSREGDAFNLEFEYPDRPGPPWSYPQTGIGVPLPLHPPYDRVHLLACGGSEQDRAGQSTPASDAAQVIELTAGAGAAWREVGPMPYKRVMGDAVILCDGTIGFFGGAQEGVGGWGDGPREFEFRDGTSYDCPDKCGRADDPIYEPSIFNPGTGMWTERGTLEEAVRPRLYHGVSLLLPDCKVMVAGSDVTWDTTSEIYTPPYFSRGPQPEIADAPSYHAAGAPLTVRYTSADPVSRAILIRTAAVSHSIAFDARALWLAITSNSNGTLTVATPPSRAVLPPGMYMLSLLSDKGVPSAAAIISFP